MVRKLGKHTSILKNKRAKIVNLIFIVGVFFFNSQSICAQTNLFPSSGKVGIGTLDPKAFLDIAPYSENGQISVVLGRLPEGNYAGDGTFLGVRGYTTSDILGKSFSLEHSFYGEVNSSINFHRGGSIQGGEISFNTYNNTERMRIDGAGNVGIGTSTPKEKLSVNGNIRAKEIKVEVANWPDYVFKLGYKLPSLLEIEKHINEKGHLPSIPTANEVEKNGIALGEMNKALLKKIEELTLHLIEMNRRINSQEFEIIKLKNNQ